MIETFGIPDYDPPECYATDELVAARADQLQALVGETFGAAYLMWDFDADAWVPDGPVLLEFGRRQIELCFGDRQEVYVTFDEVDRSRALAWFDDRNHPLRWLQNARREFAGLAFRKVERIGIGEKSWASGGVASFQPASIEFDLGDAHLAVVGTGEHNDLRFTPPELGPSFRVRWL